MPVPSAPAPACTYGCPRREDQFLARGPSRVEKVVSEVLGTGFRGKRFVCDGPEAYLHRRRAGSFQGLGPMW